MTYKMVVLRCIRLVKSQTIADIGSGIVIFIVVLVVGAAHALVRQTAARRHLRFHRRIPWARLRSARGALLVVLAYLLQVAFKDACGLMQGEDKEYLDQGKTFLERMNPEEWLERGRKMIEDRNKKSTP